MSEYYNNKRELGSEYDGSPDLYDTIVTGYTTAASALAVGAVLERLQLIQQATITTNTIFTASASSTTTLTAAALLDVGSNYLGQVAIPMAGNMGGQGRYISAYNGTTQITVTPAWAADPGSVVFIIVPSGLKALYDALVVIDAYHDVATANAATNAVMSDVIGNKTDNADQDADATEKSIIALVKGVLDVLYDDAGVATWPAAVAPGDGVSMAEGIRYIVENPPMFKYQSPAALNQATPVQNTWYEVLAATANVRIYGISAGIEDDNETLECQITIDGETIAGVGFAATHSTDYQANLHEEPITRVDQVIISATAHRESRAFLIEGHSVKIELRKTTAGGTGNLVGVVTYGVLTNTA